MISTIRRIENLIDFKLRIFSGEIFKFKSNALIKQIIKKLKKEIAYVYPGDLLNSHKSINFHAVFTPLIEKLKNNSYCLHLTKQFFQSIRYPITDLYLDKFDVRFAPALNHLATFSNTKVPIHRDTWGSNLYQQINWWAPITALDVSNTLILYPQYFNKKVKNDSIDWDLDSYLQAKKLKITNYPSTPKISEKIAKDSQKLPILLDIGEILCFSGAHLHASSNEDSQFSRASFEFRTISKNDILQGYQAQNVDCELKQSYPKIFSHIQSKEKLSLT